MSDDPRIDRGLDKTEPSRRGFLTVMAAGLGASLETRARRAAAQTPAPAAKGEVIVRVHAPAGNQGDIVEQRAKEFAEENRGIRMKLELFPTNEYVTKVQTLIAGKQLGDVLWSFSVSTYRAWAARGVLAPLDDYVKTDKYDPNQFYKNGWDGQVVNGKHYGITYKAHPGSSLLYYNRDLFAAAGLKEPTDDMTWDQLVDAATKLTKGGVYGYFTPLNHPHHHLFMTRIYGGQIISPDGKTALFNSPESLQALQFDYDLVNARKIAPPMKDVPSNPRDVFVNGNTAMYKAGTWDLSVGKVIKDKFKWSVVLAPRGPKGNRGAMFGQDYMSIAATSKVKTEAWQVVKALCDRRTGILLGLGGTPGGGNSGTAGGRPDVYESEELRNNPDYTPEVHATRVRSLKETTLINFPANHRIAEVLSVVTNAMEQMWSGTKPDKAWADTVNANMQAVLDKPV